MGCAELTSELSSECHTPTGSIVSLIECVRLVEAMRCERDEMQGVRAIGGFAGLALAGARLGDRDVAASTMLGEA